MRPNGTDPSALVGKVWNYAHVLRDAGVSSGEYVEQITCLLFLKMDQERTENLNLPSMIPEAHRWPRRGAHAAPPDRRHARDCRSAARQDGVRSCLRHPPGSCCRPMRG